MVGCYNLMQTFRPTTCKGSAAPFTASNSPRARARPVFWQVHGGMLVCLCRSGLSTTDLGLARRIGCSSLHCAACYNAIWLCFSPDLIRGSPREFWSHASEASHLAAPHAACWASQVKGRRTITALTPLSQAVRNRIERHPLSWQQMLGWLVLGFGQPLVSVCCSMFD